MSEQEKYVSNRNNLSHNKKSYKMGEVVDKPSEAAIKAGRIVKQSDYKAARTEERKAPVDQAPVKTKE